MIDKDKTLVSEFEVYDSKNSICTMKPNIGPKDNNF